MSQKELADILAISPPSLSNIERGLNYPDIERLFNIAEILEFSLDELLCTSDYCIKVLDADDSLKKSIQNLSPKKRQLLIKHARALAEDLNDL